VFGIGSNMLIYITVINNNISAADFIAFNIAFGAFSYVITQFYSIVKQFASLKSSFELVKPLLEEIPETRAATKKVTRLSGKIDVSSVSYKYTNDGPLILDEISLSIKPGEYVAIVGTTGCGKSTLMRVLLGFEKPQSGAVYFDDQDLEKLDVRSVRQRIGVVMQNGTLFADDIYSNITICAPWLTVEQSWEAAEKAGIADDIRNMPMGMFTMISEGGEGISGGQKQRLMIARAFAANPDIIMFDEATSALDNLTQSIVVSSLEKMEATRIVIAHRLSTIQKCDRIIVLHKGKVVEEGTYSSLIEKKGYFAEMAKRQIA
jgi:ABC-type bacteriocin/lantibiotic exporter with double-glycine peptidase domain